MALNSRTSLSLVVDQHGTQPLLQADKNTKLGRELFIKVLNQLRGQLKGNKKASVVSMTIDGTQPAAAFGTVTCATVIATNTVTINNAVLTAVTGAPAANQFDRTPGTDITTATNLAAAINLSTNNALITKRVEASNFANTIVLATCLAGSTVSIGGHVFVARASTTSLTNPAQDGDFDISGNDTADATSLVTAINNHPILRHQVVATSSVGTVTVRQRRGTVSGFRFVIGGIPGTTPSGISVGNATMIATAVVCISHKLPSIFGNDLPLASSGATLTVSGALFTGGAGLDVAPVRHVFGSAATNTTNGL